MSPIWAVIIVISLTGSDQSRSASGEATRDMSQRTTTVALIFCDLTTSVDSAAVPKVARDVSKLMLSFPYETKLYILPVAESPFIKPILDFTYPGKATKPSEIEKNKLLIRKVAQYAGDKIKKLHREGFSGRDAKNKPLSCIMRSLETAHSYFSQFRALKDKQFDFELIYLSDMIEECDNSPAGPVFLTKKNYKSALVNLQNYKPAFDLSYAKVSVIVSVDEYDEASQYVSYEQLKEVWKNIFIKAGFTAENFEQFNFLATIPPRFELNRSPWK